MLKPLKLKLTLTLLLVFSIFSTASHANINTHNHLSTENTDLMSEIRNYINIDSSTKEILDLTVKY